MKTTIELPDALFREVKTRAAAEGITMKTFMTQALEERMNRPRRGRRKEPEWMRLAGSLKHLHEENVAIMKVVDDEFGQIEEEDWR